MDERPEVARTAASLVAPILAAPRAGQRRLVALVGPPASGKSTLAEAVAKRLCTAGCAARVLPMDGFHLDNALLAPLGLLDRKGAPESFDVDGLLRLVAALAGATAVVHPTFDRARDIAVAGSGVIPADCDTVIVEGNYLLFDAPGWRDLGRYWDLSIRLEVPLPELERRLVARWLDHGLSRAEAEARARGNDLRNAARMADAALPADLTVSTGAI